MALSRQDVEHIADLAHLALTEEQLTQYQQQLSAILDYAARLRELSTDDILPTASVLPLHSVMREDQPADPLPHEDALSNAPEPLSGCFGVPPLR